MKNKFTFIVLFGINNFLYSQDLLYLQFPVLDTSEYFIDGDSILSELNWQSLKKHCDTTKGQYARVRVDGLIKTYTYTKQGYTANFELSLFNGKVLEYRSHVDGLCQTNYFNRKLWIDYTKTDSILSESEWILSEDEMKANYTEVIQAYYTLLGFNVRDEYGWICEYSAAGRPPKKRMAIVQLINFGRRDFIVKLLDHPNIQTKLYAADALIYLDIIGRVKEVEIENFNGRKKARKYYVRKTNEYRLTLEEINKINNLKLANYKVITCGNMGSYKQYESSTSELLSDEAIGMIYSNYLRLKDLNYLR